MKKIILPVLLAALVFSACNSITKNIFGNKTPIGKYEEKLEDSGLQNTPEGRQWLAVSQTALLHPIDIQLPHSHAGLFSVTKPQALSLKFSARQGERINFLIEKKDAASFVLYAELYKVDASGKPSLLQSPDTNIAEFSYDVLESGNYLLKIQPQLFRSGNYTLSIATGPSLYFPVADKKAYIGSVWGDARDGGKRDHEGVDIFAPKRTPAVAAADGYIENVREGGIGGKTVWLRPQGKNFTLYYAHLDEQLVQEGQQVRKGDTIGLVGNTGNAKFTPSHLHFGIYGYGGAINPEPFVKRQQKTAATIPQKKVDEYVRLVKEFKTGDSTIKKNTLLRPVAVTAKSFIAELPDGRMIETAFATVQPAMLPLKKTKLTSETALQISPVDAAAITHKISAGSSVSVLGYFNNYVFVKTETAQGWVAEAILKG